MNSTRGFSWKSVAPGGISIQVSSPRHLKAGATPVPEAESEPEPGARTIAADVARGEDGAGPGRQRKNTAQAFEKQSGPETKTVPRFEKTKSFLF